MAQTIVCMKWGTRYPTAYVNTLWSMIRRHTARQTRLVCYTDDASGIDAAVETYPLPPIKLPARMAWKPWRKVSLWQPELSGIAGDVLFIDLDVVITGSIDGFFDHVPEASFCVIENWTQRGLGIGNTSVYRFRVGAHPYLVERFEREPLRMLRRYRNSQTFISRTIKSRAYWPRDWCVSFKHTLLPQWPLNLLQTVVLPPSARVVCFTGKPDIDEARDGRWAAPWHKRFYKRVLPTPWIAEHWR